MLFAAEDFFRWQAHVEVWVLVLGLLGLGLYVSRVIAPKMVAQGHPPVSPGQKRWFAFGLLTLWLASDWPIHDIAEEYLYSIHMIQHLVLTFVMPPALLLATPTWLARLILGDGALDRWIHKLARPVAAAVIFNGLQIFTHWSGVVNASVDNGMFHYVLHTAVVLSAILLWMPVCGPIPELRISLPSQMVYLFLSSIIPTVPAAWLTFAEGAVYSAYDIPERLWDISVTSDQQAAGLIMKLVGGTYLFILITMLFFRWAALHEKARVAGRRGHTEVTERELLTWDEVSNQLETAGPAFRESEVPAAPPE